LASALHTDTKEAIAMIRLPVDRGVNLFDAAES
jgi:aryl-alcohol dehydrogenase-like predicted oxidoreductase